MRILRVAIVSLALCSAAAALAVPSYAATLPTIASGSDFTCAVVTSGAVECWGRNFEGQLGDGTFSSRHTRAAVTGLPTKAKSVTAGEAHACALLIDGSAWCWGDNSWGQIGDGTGGFGGVQKPTPVPVTGMQSGVISIGAGQMHTCAVLASGAAKCWGLNGNGQLGDANAPVQKTLPVDVVGLSAGVASISAGGRHTCAVLASGAVKCWGDNSYGQLGNAGGSSSVPVDVPGLTDVSQVTTGESHTCSLTSQGAVSCWGLNSSGQLGIGTFVNVSDPTPVVGLSAGVAAVDAGRYHTCAVLAGSGVLCWGSNTSAQLGDASMTGRSTPTLVSGLAFGVVAVAGGYGHTCAVLSSREARCWGHNDIGQLGSAAPTSVVHAPGSLVGLASAAAKVSLGLSFACARLNSGDVQCWGDGRYGQLGNGLNSAADHPVSVSGIGDAISLVTGFAHACVLLSTVEVKCWGRNDAGQLGDATTTDRLQPVTTQGFSSDVTSIWAGGELTCAVVTGGAVKCWGRNDFGQLGDETTVNKSVPTAVPALSSGVASVAVGAYHTCALLTAGSIECWGRNDRGQLGNGDVEPSLKPVAVTGISNATAIVAGQAHTCALLATGGVECWGSNQSGALGDGTTDIFRTTPADVSGLTSGVGSISARLGHTCARVLPSSLVCWGSNAQGQLGDGTTTFSNVPVPVAGIADAAGVAAGGGHSCAEIAGNAVRCWGGNQFGQLADGLAFREESLAVSGGSDYLLPGETPVIEPPPVEPPVAPPVAPPVGPAPPAVATRHRIARYSRARRSGRYLMMRVSHTFLLPAGTDRAKACVGRVTISTRPIGSRRTSSTRPLLRAYRSGCRAIGTLRLTRRSMNRRLSVRARFAGSSTLAAYSVRRAVRVR